MVLTFSPTATGAQSSLVTVNYNDGVTTQAVTDNLVGTGTTPANLTLNLGPTFDYGTLANGATLDQSFTVTNSGGVTSSAMNGSGLAAPFTFKGGTYPGTGGTCGATLAAAGTCTVVATFAPTASGSYSGIVTIGYNDGAVVQSAGRAVIGTGAAPALLTLNA